MTLIDIVPWIQTFIFFFTLIITIYIYKKNRFLSLQASAKLVLMQINDIEKNIEYIKKECINSSLVISERESFNSLVVFENNFWDCYRHELSKKLNSSDYELISKFYETAMMIRKFQVDIKNFIMISLQHRALHYYQSIYSGNKLDVGNLEINVYIPRHYSEYLYRYISIYKNISGTTAYSALKEITKDRGALRIIFMKL